MAHKESYFFPHDDNARGDEKIVRLLRSQGWAGYGLYWALIEKLYAAGGLIRSDWDSLAYDLRTEPEIIKTLATKLDLFYVKKGRLGSHSVDRRLAERQAKINIARVAGRASGIARQPALNGRSTDVQQESSIRSTDAEPERDRETERYINNRTTAPSAVDFSNFRIKLGDKYPSVYVLNIPVDECMFLLKNAPRLSKQYRAALQWRVGLKQADMTPAQREASRTT